jgi:hypothetical protein
MLQKNIAINKTKGHTENWGLGKLRLPNTIRNHTKQTLFRHICPCVGTQQRPYHFTVFHWGIYYMVILFFTSIMLAVQAGQTERHFHARRNELPYDFRDSHKTARTHTVQAEWLLPSA